jgi:predicted double-glycine peptidase
MVCLVQTAHCEPLLFSLAMQTTRMVDESRRIQSRSDSAIIRQESEITCGPAALASLLCYYFSEETSENELAELSGTYEKGTTTLLGLRDACIAKGHEAIGYNMTLPQLMREVEASKVPVVVHFNEPSLHYALVVGQVDDFILISDPSVGNVSMSRDDFLRRWSEKALVVKPGERTVDSKIVEQRKQSAATRLGSLKQAGRLMSAM